MGGFGNVLKNNYEGRKVEINKQALHRVGKQNIGTSTARRKPGVFLNLAG